VLKKSEAKSGYTVMLEDFWLRSLHGQMKEKRIHGGGQSSRELSLGVQDYRNRSCDLLVVRR
jgi:hypothetical protein